jgi:hypothetical protein
MISYAGIAGQSVTVCKNKKSEALKSISFIPKLVYGICVGPNDKNQTISRTVSFLKKLKFECKEFDFFYSI